MMPSSADRRASWESQYALKGRVWKGEPRLPVLPCHGNVLEVGCGNGKTLSALRRSGSRVIALDHSIHALCLCDGERVRADLLRLPFADASFDSVFIVHVLGHLSAQERKLAADGVMRVLRPGGVIVAVDFHVDDLRHGSGREVEPRTFEREGITYHYFDDGELESCFPDAMAEGCGIWRVERRHRSERVVRSECWTVLRG